MLAVNRSLVVLAAALVMASASDTTTEPSAGSSEPATTDVGRIMFQRAPGGEVVGEVETDVYVVDADGSESDVELLVPDGGAGRWSPDGSEVSVFCCDDGMIAHIVDVVTGDVRGVETPDPTLELFCNFGWSPDGERLVCEGYGVDDPSRNGIYSVRASDGGGWRGSRPTRTVGTSPGTTRPTGPASRSCASRTTFRRGCSSSTSPPTALGQVSRGN